MLDCGYMCFTWILIRWRCWEGMGWGLRICISNQAQGVAHFCGPWTKLSSKDYDSRLEPGILAFKSLLCHFLFAIPLENISNDLFWSRVRVSICNRNVFKKSKLFYLSVLSLLCKQKITLTLAGTLKALTSFQPPLHFPICRENGSSMVRILIWS